MSRPFLEGPIVAFGGSAGGIKALRYLMQKLPEDLPLIMIGALHVSSEFLEGSASGIDPSGKRVIEAFDKMRPEKGKLYLAPSGYHLLVEEDLSLALDVSPEVNYSRPSIDVFFSSVASSVKENAVGVLLSGAGLDGAEGLAEIKKAGGLTIVQSPEDAEFDVMPRAALQTFDPDHVMDLKDIGEFLIGLSKRNKEV